MARKFIKSFSEISGPGDSVRFLESVRDQDPSVYTAFADAVEMVPEQNPFNVPSDKYTERYRYGDVEEREVTEVGDQSLLTQGDSQDEA
jgi:hypothetical protein